MLHPGPYLTAVFMLFTLSWLMACSDEPESAEQQIRQFIATGEEYAEQRKISALKELISENYRDERNLDQKGILRLAQAYFMGHQNINLFTHIKDIHITRPDQAHVTLFAAMTGTAVDSMDAFISLRARLYVFELALIKKNDEWKLLQAKWRRAQINEMLNDP